ncbi:MAG: thioredoxin domain-containing protein, partial [Bryobacteraceae bacterium]
MTHPDGGFYSAEDADSVIDPANPEQKGEGAFYIWSIGELSRLLEPPARDWFGYAYGVEPDGNVANDPQGEFTAKNILFEDHTAEETAAKFGVAVEEVRSALEGARARLLAERSKRVRPHLDDKILTGWNALMISAFAKGAQILDDTRYRDAAVRATAFLLRHLYIPDTGILLRRFRDGEAAIDGFLDDYAFFIQALLDLYETVFQPYYLELAVHLTGTMLERFEDSELGGLFSTADGEPGLIVRMKDDYDGAEPSGNSVAADVLLRLARFTERADFSAAAERIFRAFAGRIDAAPAGVPQLLAALLRFLAASRQVVVVGDIDSRDTQGMLRAVRRRFLPNTGVLLVDSDETRDTLQRYAAA